MSKARYTITIKSRTGDVVFEKEINAMIGAVADGTDVTGITLQGSEDEMILALNTVNHEINRFFEKES